MSQVKRLQGEVHLQTHALKEYKVNGITNGHTCSFRVYPKGSPSGTATPTTETADDGKAFLVVVDNTETYIGDYTLEISIFAPEYTSALDVELTTINFQAL